MSALPDIRKTVLLNAPIQRVWRAIASAEGLAAWWMDSTFKPVLGHEFVLHTGPYGDSPCKVIDIAPPNRLEFSWGKDWRLAFELREIEEQTELTLIHSGWDSDKLTEFNQPHTDTRSFMEQGWGDLGKLRSHVEGQ